MTTNEKLVTDEEMVQAIKTLRAGCKQRKRRYCLIAATCDDNFGDAAPGILGIRKCAWGRVMKIYITSL